MEVSLPKSQRRAIVPKSGNQQRFWDAIGENHISFGVGSAGSGKSTIALARGVQLLEQGVVKQIILCRPAVEAGERLGYLPGSLDEKLEPYVRPIMEIAKEIAGVEQVKSWLTNGVISVIPIGFLRGWTVKGSLLLADEAQNLSVDQMKMLLTRLGDGSKFVITGDPSQTDIHGLSGLMDAVGRLQGVPGISTIHFETRDVVRHPLVSEIIHRYE